MFHLIILQQYCQTEYSFHPANVIIDIILDQPWNLGIAFKPLHKNYIPAF